MEYTPCGDEVSVEACIIQTTVALDVTGILALESRDSGTMLSVADSWMKLADFMADYEQAAAEAAKGNKEKPPFGFAGGEKIELDGDFEVAEQLEIDYDVEDEHDDD